MVKLPTDHALRMARKMAEAELSWIFGRGKKDDKSQPAPRKKRKRR